MRHIKMYEDINDIEMDLKKLLSHIISILTEFGYSQSNYIDNRTWESEFYKGPEYSFCIKMKVDIFTKKHDIDLKLIQSLATEDDFSNQLAEYLKTISGINFVLKTENPFKSNKLGAEFKYTIKGGNIDKIIKQITKESIELNTTTNNYNL